MWSQRPPRQPTQERGGNAFQGECSAAAPTPEEDRGVKGPGRPPTSGAVRRPCCSGGLSAPPRTSRAGRHLHPRRTQAKHCGRGAASRSVSAVTPGSGCLTRALRPYPGGDPPPATCHGGQWSFSSNTRGCPLQGTPRGDRRGPASAHTPGPRAHTVRRKNLCLVPRGQDEAQAEDTRVPGSPRLRAVSREHASFSAPRALRPAVPPTAPTATATTLLPRRLGQAPPLQQKCS